MAAASAYPPLTYLPIAERPGMVPFGAAPRLGSSIMSELADTSTDRPASVELLPVSIQGLVQEFSSSGPMWTQRKRRVTL